VRFLCEFLPDFSSDDGGLVHGENNAGVMEVKSVFLVFFFEILRRFSRDCGDFVRRKRGEGGRWWMCVF
jgi:hypothetical protein